MALSSNDYLRGLYTAKNAVGAPSINSDATFVIDGHEGLMMQAKQFPWPVIGSFGEIEVPMPMGGMYWEQQQLKTALQGPLTFTETSTGIVMKFLTDIVAAGGKFNAFVYEGTPDAFVRGYKLRGCFFVPDVPDRDWENRAQVTQIAGTIFANFFGETLSGNVAAL